MRDTKIDIARGICMVSILLFHTEVYYTGEEIIYLEVLQRVSDAERRSWVKNCTRYGIRV